MGAGRSLQLGRIFGIRIGVSPSWFFVLFLLIASLSSQYRAEYPDNDSKAFALATITAACFFLSILLHELGHAFTARASGIRVLGVELWLFGGFTTMEREAPTPQIDLRVAAAGPLVTLAVAAATFVAGAAAIGSRAFVHAVTTPHPGIGAAASVLSYLTFINVVLLVFNLVPGLPLDGGRIARAVIWWRSGDAARATTATARLGRGFSYLLGAGGILLLANGIFNGLWLLLIAFVIGSSARQLLVRTAVTERLGGLRVRDVMDTEPVTMPAQTKLDRALDDFFIRYGWDWFPVVDVMGHFLGLVSRDAVEAVPDALRAGSSVDEVIARESRGAFGIRVEEPVEALLASEPLRRLGALIAVDAEGVLRGVVTIEQVRRALTPASRPA